MKIFYTIALNGKRNIIASIHPNMEIRRNRVACINELPAKLKKTTVHINERIDKLKIDKQIQDIRVIEFYSSDLTNQQTRTCNHLNLNIMDTS